MAENLLELASAAWSAAYNERPTDARCEREIEISVVGDRCIYVNDYRVAGGKPYVGENLPHREVKAKVRDVLDAFSPEEIEAYLREKQSREAYLIGTRTMRDAMLSHRSPHHDN